MQSLWGRSEKSNGFHSITKEWKLENEVKKIKYAVNKGVLCRVNGGYVFVPPREYCIYG
jgi:uncharacterized OB-fold protein